MTTQAKWYFIKEDPNDRMRATVRKHALGGSGLTHEERVIREAIQNSVDATLENQKTDVLIWNRLVLNGESTAFRKLLGFDLPNSPFSRLKHLGLQPDNALDRMTSTDVDDKNFYITIIEDRNTCGLGYNDRDKVDRFDELCLSYGQDTTAVEAGRGGSYGFGKSVYEQASDCNLFIVYSVFDRNPDTAHNEIGSHARLFACATFRGHTIENIKYRGRALFGMLKETGDQVECRPIVDETAHDIAQQLGFVRREPTDTGTSIMIVGSNMDTLKLRGAIENYWWPRLYSNLLSVELWDNDKVAEYPEPKSRDDLRPYLRCYSLIEEGVAKDKVERLHTLRGNKHVHQQGNLALVPLPQQTDNGSDDPEQDTYLESTVALIRSGPRMVVEYLNPGGGSTARFAGVFLSNPAVEEQLHLSEPAAHNSWSPHASRFADAYPDDPAKEKQSRELVRGIVHKIKDHTRRFRRSLDPPDRPQPLSGSSALRNLLSRIMSGNFAGPQPTPTPDIDPFAINIRTGLINKSTSSQVTASVHVSLNDHAPKDETKAILEIEPYLTMDDDNKRDSQSVLQLDSAKLNGNIVTCIGNSLLITISRTQTTHIEVKSEDFPKRVFKKDVRLLRGHRQALYKPEVRTPP